MWVDTAGGDPVQRRMNLRLCLRRSGLPQDSQAFGLQADGKIAAEASLPAVEMTPRARGPLADESRLVELGRIHQPVSRVGDDLLDEIVKAVRDRFFPGGPVGLPGPSVN